MDSNAIAVWLRIGLLSAICVLASGCGRFDWNKPPTTEQAPRIPVLSVLSSPSAAIAKNGLGTWVSVGNKTIWSSGDGREWRSANGAVSNDWRAVVSAPDSSRWVAVGKDGISTSTDGHEWTKATGAVATEWTSVRVAPDGKRWVAVGNEGMATSADGQQWEPLPPLGGQWRSLAIDGKLWVAAGANGIAVSKDGRAWQIRESRAFGLEQFQYYYAVTKAPAGLWVAVGGRQIATSVDGWTWEAFRFEKFLTAVTVAADGKRWVACGPDGLVSSTDPRLPENWEAAPLNFRCTALSVVKTGENGHRWIAAGSDGLAWSDGGSNWTLVADPEIGRGWQTVQADTPGRPWVAIGAKGLATSVDGQSWRRDQKALGDAWREAAQDDGSKRWVVVGKGGIATSADGAHWERATGDLDRGWSSVAFSAKSGLWIAAGPYGMIFSRNGKEWQPVPQQVGEAGRVASWSVVRAAPDGERWVAANPNSTAMSKDGMKWVGKDQGIMELSSPFEAEEKRRVVRDYRVALFAGGKKWVAIRGSSVEVSADGLTWEPARGVYGDPLSVAASPDGHQWVVATAHNNPYGMAQASISNDAGNTWEDAKGLTGDGEVWFSAALNGWINVGPHGISESKDGKKWRTPWRASDIEHARAPAETRSLDLPKRRLVLAYDPIGKAMVSLLTPFAASKAIYSGVPQQLIVLDGALVRVDQGSRTISASKGEWERSIIGEDVISFRLFGEPKSCASGKLKLTLLGGSDHDFSDNLLPLQWMGTRDEDVDRLPMTTSIPFKPQDLRLAVGQTYWVALRLACDDWEVFAPAFTPAMLTYAPTPLSPWLYLPMFFLGLALLFGLLHLIKPLWVLALYRRSHSMGALGEMTIPLINLKVATLVHITNLFVVVWLAKRPSTLNAWVRQRQGRWHKAFEAEPTAMRCQGYVALPCRMDDPRTGELLQEPGPAIVERLLRADPTVIEIVGQGGAGKTMLIVQICRWLHQSSAGEVRRACLAVLIEEDTTDALALARSKLEVGLSEKVDAELFGWLLKRGNVMLVFDRLSEKNEKTIQHACKLRRSGEVAAMLVSTRISLNYEGMGVRRVHPLPLGPDTVGLLLQALLQQRRDKGALVTYRAATDLQVRLADMIQLDGKEAKLTPLIVRLFIERALKLEGEGLPMSELPGSVPDAYFTYLVDVNPKEATTENWMSDVDMLRSARCLAVLSIGENFKPQDFSREAAEQALEAAGWPKATRHAPIERLKSNHILIERRSGARFMVSFALDPVAEFLAADEMLDQCHGARVAEDKLRADVAAKGAEVRGFLSALDLVLAHRRGSGPRPG